MAFWAVAGCLLVACLLFFSCRALKGAFVLFREYFVLWNVAVGARSDRRQMSTKIRLHAYVCRTDLLDEVSLNELYSFAQGMVDSDFTIHDFHKVLLSYRYAILCRERKDGSLRGMMLLGIDHKVKDGQNYTLVRLGLSLFLNFYRGGPLLYYVTAYHVLKELVWHPLTPLYIAGKAFSYKSYMVVVNSFKAYYPHYKLPTPAFEKSIIDDFGKGIATSSEIYDRETGVLCRERSAIKEHIASITKEERENPHIKFFEEQNPGWTKGHQLCFLAKVTWLDLIRGFLKAAKRSYTARKEGLVSPGGKRKSSKYSRQMSFQCESAGKFAVNCTEMDATGNYVRSTNAWPTFSQQTSVDFSERMKF